MGEDLFELVMSDLIKDIFPCQQDGTLHGNSVARLKSKGIAFEVRVQQIKEAVRSGFNTARDIAEIVGLSRRVVVQYACKSKIELQPGPELQQKGRAIKRREIDTFVASDTSVEEIRYAVCSSQLHTYLLNNLQIGLVEVLKQKCRQQGDLALEYAVDYYYSKIKKRHPAEISFKKLHELFELYVAAKEQCVHYSLWELGEKLNVPGTTVGRILSAVGLEPMHGKVTKNRTPYWKISAINRAGVLVDFNDSEIGYFLNVSPRVVFNHRDVKRVKKTSKDRIRSYIRLSQIYEAVDAGFNAAEISELLDTSVRRIKSSIRKRSVLEQRIIYALDVLYPEEKHDKPYLSSPR